MLKRTKMNPLSSVFPGGKLLLVEKLVPLPYGPDVKKTFA